ncbi:hypothetical protein QZH41_004734 [Actinostola sp. cb2023]|nr:hypothetical protein QZH41_004734 [Actinostola sp. cb2023]
MLLDGPNSSTLLHKFNDSVSSLKVTQTEEVISVLFNVSLMVAVIASNGLILGAFALNAHLRAIHNILIMGLSFADFLVGVISLPCWIYLTHCQYNNQKMNFYGYQFYITADIFIGASSILHLTGMSIERCHAVMKPIIHKILSRRIFYLGSAGAWLFAAIMASLQPLQYRSWENVYTLLSATLFFYIPTVIISIAYICVFKRSKSRPGVPLMSHRASRAMLAREIRLTLTVGLITVLFVLAWLPLFSLTMVATFNLKLLPDPLTNQRLLGFVKWMHYTSSVINPFLYSYRNNDMRRTIKLIIHKHIMRKNICLKEMLPRSRALRHKRISNCRPPSDSSKVKYKAK